MKRLALLTPALTLLASTTPALAHLGPAGHGSLAAGASHPLFGTDHLLAMVAVGLWAALSGGRALWTVPAGFVGAMVAGFLLALAGIGLPMVEPLILGSVIVLGGLVALTIRLPLGAAVALVATFGLFHGHAHGAEMGAATALPYLAGFAGATALLHLAGIGLGRLLTGLGRSLAMRGAGGLVALAGAGFVLAG
ncbi:protein hupE [Aquicoccus sp. SCR17]|nr:protein hupE [Carideicomes alvinocaridis]